MQDPTAALGRAWARAIGRTSYVSMSLPELRAFLTGLAADLVRGLAEDDLSAGARVGERLVAAHFTHAMALERSLVALDEGLAGLAAPRRLAALLASLAAGYAGALRVRTLAEQEQIRVAAMAARLEAEQGRWDSEARFKAVFDEAAIGIGISTVDGRILEVNRALCTMSGYTEEEFRSRNVVEFLHPQDSPDLLATYQELAAGTRERIRTQKPYFRRDGTAIWTDLVVSLVRDQDGTPRLAVAMIEDITDRHTWEARLSHQALHDPLTQLPNRTLFFERLGAALADPDPDARIGLCYLDLDGFKMVNDTRGHDVGDALLQAVADRLAGRLAERGTLVARMGGDEFVLLVERSAGEADAVAVARDALRVLREPVDLGGHPITISASIGVVERSVRGTSAAELMKAADTTLYWAKKDGRDRWALFDAHRHAEDVSRYHLAARLPAALADEHFFVEYQPLVDLADGRAVGVEALVRWRHPELGVLGPDRFIGLAEQTGHIVPLGRWVLAEACRQARDWLAARPGTPLIVSVNLAERQVREPTIVADVARALAEAGLEPAQLQLELTESAVMGSTGSTLRRLHELADMGVRIAIDDFGTGYSNLAYLRNLPVHTLKLAGPFVAGLRSADGVVDQKIVATLIRLAHSLQLSVTAEGVETAGQAERLRALGCDTAQGWYYAPARPAAAVAALLS